MYCDRKVNISDQKVHPFLRVFWSFLSEYDYVQWNTCVHDSPNMATSSQVWLVGLEAWFSLWVREVPGSNPGQALFIFFTFPDYNTIQWEPSNPELWGVPIWGELHARNFSIIVRARTHCSARQVITNQICYWNTKFSLRVSKFHKELYVSPVPTREDTIWLLVPRREERVLTVSPHFLRFSELSITAYTYVHACTKHIDTFFRQQVHIDIPMSLSISRLSSHPHPYLTFCPCIRVGFDDFAFFERTWVEENTNQPSIIVWL